MDVIDTTLRMGSREKLHPKHGYDEEVSVCLYLAMLEIIETLNIS